MNKRKLKASFYSLANCGRKRILYDHGRPRGRDTRLFWSETCRNPCQLRSSQSTPLRALPDYVRMNKILGNRTLHFLLVQDTKSRILLCTYQDDRILQLGYELCHNFHRLGNSNSLHYLSCVAYHPYYGPVHSCCSFPSRSHAHTSLTDMFQVASSYLYWNHGKKDISSNCDSRDLKYMGLFWRSIGPGTWCTEPGRYFLCRTS